MWSSFPTTADFGFQSLGKQQFYTTCGTDAGRLLSLFSFVQHLVVGYCFVRESNGTGKSMISQASGSALSPMPVYQDTGLALS